jgi:hypothetical protein
MLILSKDDREAIGILADEQAKILWTVLLRPSPGGLRYRAYDVSGSGTIPGGDAFLGERTTPPGFTAHAAHDGAAYGLKKHPEFGYLFAAFDMRVSTLRNEEAEVPPTNWGN